MAQNTLDALKRRIQTAEDEGKTAKAKLLKAALKRERAKYRAKLDKKDDKQIEDNEARRGQTGAGRAIIDILRNRGADVDEDVKKDS